MKLMGLSCIFPSYHIRETAEYYQLKLGFDIVEYLQSEQPHICMYKDDIEIILTQANNEEIKPNRVLYGYGYDAYVYVKNQYELQEKLKNAGVKIRLMKGTISEVPMKQKDVDVVFTTANYRNPLEKPHLSVFGLVSGIGKDATRKKVADLLQKLAEE